jgi:hypothetical protein
MNKLLITAAALIVCVSLNTSSVKAADLSPAHAQVGLVPSDPLAAMGLSGMPTLSDAQGMHIRGMGTKITVVQVAVVIQAFAFNRTPVVVQTVNIGSSGHH